MLTVLLLAPFPGLPPLPAGADPVEVLWVLAWLSVWVVALGGTVRQGGAPPPPAGARRRGPVDRW
ncbi:MAG: hypothetical protein ACLGIR_01560 [Actinomycetes bacterium]